MLALPLCLHWADVCAECTFPGGTWLMAAHLADVLYSESLDPDLWLDALSSILLLFLLVIAFVLLTHMTQSLLNIFCVFCQLQELVIQCDGHTLERLACTGNFSPCS